MTRAKSRHVVLTKKIMDFHLQCIQPKAADMPSYLPKTLLPHDWESRTNVFKTNSTTSIGLFNRIQELAPPNSELFVHPLLKKQEGSPVFRDFALAYINATEKPKCMKIRIEVDFVNETFFRDLSILLEKSEFPLECLTLDFHGERLMQPVFEILGLSILRVTKLVLLGNVDVKEPFKKFVDLLNGDISLVLEELHVDGYERSDCGLGDALFKICYPVSKFTLTDVFTCVACELPVSVYEKWEMLESLTHLDLRTVHLNFASSSAILKKLDDIPPEDFKLEFLAVAFPSLIGSRNGDPEMWVTVLRSVLAKIRYFVITGADYNFDRLKLIFPYLIESKTLQYCGFEQFYGTLKADILAVFDLAKSSNIYFSMLSCHLNYSIDSLDLVEIMRDSMIGKVSVTLPEITSVYPQHRDLIELWRQWRCNMVSLLNLLRFTDLARCNCPTHRLGADLLRILFSLTV